MRSGNGPAFVRFGKASRMATPKNQSVQKAFALLRSFRGAEEWVTNAELSRRTGFSEACAHRLMKTLEEIGVVVRDKRGCYRPGMVLAALSKDVAVGDLIRATSEDALAGLGSFSITCHGRYYTDLSV